MHLHSLRVASFRNFDSFTLHCEPGINWIYGPNAIGKTSLLEAIYLCIAGRSFRSSKPAEMIQHTKEAYAIDLLFSKHEVMQRLHVKQSAAERKLSLNKTPYPTFAALLGTLPGVIFTTEDLNLIKGSPSYRRLFIDLQLAQSDPLYVYHLARYQRALKQRNALLKAQKAQSLAIWDHEMAKAASYIMQQRRITLSKLEACAKDILLSLSPKKEALSIRYQASFPSEEASSIEKHLHATRKRDLEKRTSQSGPHRDEILLCLEEKDARFFSSEGQKQSLVASLKFAEWQRLKQQVGESPLMLIDDIGSCLDSKRTEGLLHLLETCEQCFLSSPQPLQSKASCSYLPLLDLMKD